LSKKRKSNQGKQSVSKGSAKAGAKGSANRSGQKNTGSKMKAPTRTSIPSGPGLMLQDLPESTPEIIERGNFFSRFDKLSFFIAYGVAMLVYYFTLPNSINLEDGGELVVAADYLGVPHPPGYPIWTLFAWLFQWIFHGVSYGDYPNPAWSIALCSAFFGALACGIVAMLISKSGAHVVEALSENTGSVVRNYRPPLIGFVLGFLTFAGIFLAPSMGGFGSFLKWVAILFGIVVPFAYLAGCAFMEYVLRRKVSYGTPDNAKPVQLSIGWIGQMLYGVFPALFLVLALMVGNTTAISFILFCIIAIPVLDFVIDLLQDESSALTPTTTGILSCCAGIAGGLLLAFSPVMWTQSNIVEVYSLNAFFMAIIALLTYLWMVRPDKEWLLYLTSFLVGLAITNHQSIIFAVPFLLVAIAYRDRRLAITAFMFCCAGGCVLFAVKAWGIRADYIALLAQSPQNIAAVNEASSGMIQNFLISAFALLVPLVYLLFRGLISHVFIIISGVIGALIINAASAQFFDSRFGAAIPLFLIGLLFFFGPLVMHYLRREEFYPWPKLYGMFTLTGLGLAFLLYMPFASEQNPPMNWGYPRTLTGFKHAVGRGQYEKISLSDNLKKYQAASKNAITTKTKEAAQTTLGQKEEALALAKVTLSDLEAQRTETDNPELNAKITAANQALFKATTEVATAKNNVAAQEKAFLAAHKRKHFFFYQMAYFFYGIDKTKVFSMARQFTVPICLLGILPFLVFFKLGRHIRSWLNGTLVCFFFVSVIFLIFQYPALNNQDLFIKRVQYIQAHALFAIWCGYGLLVAAFILTYLVKKITKSSTLALGTATAIGVAGACAFPYSQIHRNATDEHHIRIMGSNNQDGHNHGWHFGFYQLRGANGIILDLIRDEKDPTFTIDQRAIDFLEKFSKSPENIAHVKTFLGQENMDEKSFKSQVMKGLTETSRDEKRLVSDAGKLSSYLNSKPPMGITDAALTYLRAEGGNPAIITALEAFNGKEISYTELMVICTASNIAAKDITLYEDAARAGVPSEQLRLSTTSFEMLTVQTNLFSSEQLASLSDEMGYLWLDESEFNEKLDTFLEDAELEAPAYKDMVVQAAKVGAHLPAFDPTWPPEMEPNAIFWGGTDPGRFVPTYMIYSAKCRQDVFLITQNALADHTYMNIMRDLYGNQIWLPSVYDSNDAFKEFDNKRLRGEIASRGSVNYRLNRMQVQGVGDVMQINAILCKQMFDRNTPKHSFYVEESYVMPWMYEYMTPHGLIMKVEAEPSVITDELAKKDHRFWAWYTDKLLSDPNFREDVIARKTFSKLRGAIAGLYEKKGRLEDARIAFEQSLALYPESPEATTRFSHFCFRTQDYDRVREIMTHLGKWDPENANVANYINNANRLEKVPPALKALEDSMAAQPKFNVQGTLQAMQYSQALFQTDKSKAYARKIYNYPGLAKAYPDAVFNVIHSIYGLQNMDFKDKNELLREAVNQMVKFHPTDYRTYMEQAALLIRENKIRPSRQPPTGAPNLHNQYAIYAAKKAIELNRTAAIGQFRTDAPSVRRFQRFAALERDSSFARMLATPASQGAPRLGQPTGFPGL